MEISVITDPEIWLPGNLPTIQVVTLSVKPFPAGLESLKLHVTRRGILEMMHRDGLHLILLAFNAENEQTLRASVVAH